MCTLCVLSVYSVCTLCVLCVYSVCVLCGGVMFVIAAAALDR